MKILDGKKLASEITQDLKSRAALLNKKPLLIIINVGDNPASQKYVSSKIKKATEIGIKAKEVKVSAKVSQEKLEKLVAKKSKKATGIIVQLPLPEHISKQKVLDLIPFEKDVDGLATNNNLVTPATPKGIMTLMKRYDVELKGKKVAVVGQSNLVGKPVADLCELEGAKVSRYTKETTIVGTEKADVLIVAAGQANLIKKENIKKGVVIIDVGINSIADESAMKKIVGDVDRDSVGELPNAISPVPGGVGPMTVISLMQNVIEAAERNN